MAYGFNLFNAAGLLAISSNYPILSFLGKYVGSVLGTPASGMSYYQVTVTCVGRPIAFIGTTSGSAWVGVEQIVSSGVDTWTIRANSTFKSGALENVPTQVDFYVFIKPVSPTGYGIKATTPAGEPAINLNTRLLKLAAFSVQNSVETTGLSTETAMVSYAGSPLLYGSIPMSWAVCPGSMGYITGLATNTRQHACRIGVCRTDATSYSWGRVRLGTQPPLFQGDPGYISIVGGQGVMFIDTSIYQ